MRRSVSRLSAVMVLGLLLAAVVTAAGVQKEKKRDKTPAPVLAAIKARFKDARVIDVSEDKEDGKVVYDVTVKYKGEEIDVTLTAEGAITRIEKEISAKDLPKAVAKALEDKYPKATYEVVEEVIKVEKKEEQPPTYEVVLVTADKKSLEVEVTAEGKIIREEKQGSAKPDK